MRKALIVGIDYYEIGCSLFGCVNDANNVKKALERNQNGTLNFDIQVMTAINENSMITKRKLKDKIMHLFSGDSDVALLYYSGHGYIENTGGFLVTSECQHGDEGLSLHELMQITNNSEAKNKLIFLDSCFSGIAGDLPNNNAFAEIKEGVSIFTACDKDQYATEINGQGVYTNLLVDALLGGASNLLGDVTPGSVYAHIDQSLGPWEQRPVFKTNVKTFTSLRKNNPSIELEDLKLITTFFPDKEDEYQLDPTYEPESECPDKKHTHIFDILQKYNRINLLIPVNAKHMYFAAMENKSCKLTPLGKHYWNLVNKNRI